VSFAAKFCFKKLTRGSPTYTSKIDRRTPIKRRYVNPL
jgi:hypothetical protein